MPKVKNIIIFLLVFAIIVAAYIFFFKKPSQDNGSALVSSTGSSAIATASPAGNMSADSATQDFLNLLLSVKEIKLDDSIFSDIAFQSLDGSHSITLTPDGTEGRPNPFAPIGSDVVATPPASSTTSNTSGSGGNSDTGGSSTGGSGLPTLP